MVKAAKHPVSAAQRQAEFRKKAMSTKGRARLTIMLPASSLSALDRLARHTGFFKWKVLADLLDTAAKQLPGNTFTSK